MIQWLHDTNAGVWLTPILVVAAVMLSRAIPRLWVWMLWIFGGSLVVVFLMSLSQ